jgi:hypothetical protein
MPVLTNPSLKVSNVFLWTSGGSIFRPFVKKN